MKTIPPAEIFIINKLQETQPNSNKPPTPKQVEEWMIEFAKMHVIEALKLASENASLQIEETNSSIRYKSHGCKGRTFIIAKDSILTDCFLDNVV